MSDPLKEVEVYTVDDLLEMKLIMDWLSDGPITEGTLILKGWKNKPWAWVTISDDQGPNVMISFETAPEWVDPEAQRIIDQYLEGELGIAMGLVREVLSNHEVELPKELRDKLYKAAYGGDDD